MRICLFGAGNIAEAHVLALRAAGATVTAVCTRGDSGQRLADAHGLRHYTDGARMLDQERPDGACLLTQPAAYAELLDLLAARGTPVLIEKPAGYDSAHGRALRAHLPPLAMVAHNRRFYANLGHAREQIGEAPLTAHFFVCERARDFRQRPQADRDRWHVMNAVHGLDTLRFLFGEVVEIAYLHRGEALDFCRLPRVVHAELLTERGHRVRFSSHFDSPGGWRCYAFGAAREVIIEPMEKTAVKVIGAREEFDTPAEDRDFKPGFVAQARTFLAGITAPTALPAAWVHFDDALRSIALCEAVYEGAPLTR